MGCVQQTTDNLKENHQVTNRAVSSEHSGKTKLYEKGSMGGGHFLA
jgi:hypothetical protein